LKCYGCKTSPTSPRAAGSAQTHVAQQVARRTHAAPRYGSESTKGAARVSTCCRCQTRVLSRGGCRPATRMPHAACAPFARRLRSKRSSVALQSEFIRRCCWGVEAEPVVGRARSAPTKRSEGMLCQGGQAGKPQRECAGSRLQLAQSQAVQATACRNLQLRQSV